MTSSPSTDVRRYLRGECVPFYRNRDAFGGFSNMHPGFALRINDVDIKTSEALYQVIRFSHRPDIQEMILAQHSGMAAKMVFQPHKAETRPDWHNIRVPTMRWTTEVKLAQHWIRYGELLERSGDLPIVEASTRDGFWGAIPDETGYTGVNALGRTIMGVRGRWKECASPEQFVVRPPEIPNFLILGRPVQTMRASDHLQTPGQTFDMDFR